MNYFYSNFSNNSGTERELCLRAQEGERTAEEILAVRYFSLVKSCARPYFLAGGDSEDLIQEGMLGLLTAIRSFDPERGTAFGTYARACVQNRIVSAVRAAAAGKHQLLNHSESLSERPFAENASDPAVSDPAMLVIDMEEQKERMRRLSEQLSGFENSVLDLYLEGRSYQDMAEKLHRPVKSVDNAIQRIRRKAAPILHGESRK